MSVDGHQSSTRTESQLLRADSDTVFVLGNGPSLKGVDLVQLSTFSSIGMNAAYRYWDQISWQPTYYACLDLVLGLSHIDAIGRMVEAGNIHKFLLRDNLIEALGSTANARSVISYDALMRRDRLFGSPIVTTGSGAALWGAHMGYRKIALLGIDAAYKEIVDGAERKGGIELEIVSQSENPNYFFEGYQKPGDRYNIPNPEPELHLRAWKATGRRISEFTDSVILSAHSGPALRFFPQVNLDQFISDGSEVMEPLADPMKDAEPVSQISRRSFVSRILFLIRRDILKYALVSTASALLMAYALASGGCSIATIWPILFCVVWLWMLSCGWLFHRRAVSEHLRAIDSRILDSEAVE